MRFLSKITLAFFIVFSAFAANSQEGRVGNIIIEGNQRVEKATVLSYLDFSAGDKYDQGRIDSSVKQLFSTGLFADISVSRSGADVIIKVEENPIINKISFEGNKRIKDENLTAETDLRPRSVYTKSKVQDDAKRIEDAYRKSGRFSIAVEPKIVKLDQNRVNLVYEIEEGKKTTIGKIVFIGNKFFDDGRLKKVINSKESHWYSFLSGNDTYDADRIAFDKETLRKFYLSKGYADFKVISSTTEITRDKKSFILTFTVEEGQKYKFGKINISSNLPEIKIDEFKEDTFSIEGETFNADLIDKTVEKITNRLNDKGYAFVEINPQYQRDGEKMVMGIDYQISEGPKVYIESIDITGNVRTLDKVIRREFRIAEGDPFNSAKLRRSQQRVRNLGFFDKVDMERERGDADDKARIKVDVKEKSTGELTFGAGFSTNDGPLGNVSVRERNLLGRGQDLRVGYQQSARVSQLDLGFTEPYFMGKDVAAGFDLFAATNDQIEESSYKSESQGGTLRASYSLTENLRHTVKYYAKSVDVSEVQANASTFIKQMEGTKITSAVGHSLLYDRRDSTIEPTDGYYLRFNEDFAGLGGDTQYVKHEVSSGYYKPMFREDVILNLSASGGHIMGWGDKEIRIDDRFFIGGNNLRGFRNSGIGPRDNLTRDALGGNMYYTGTMEVSFPLGLPDELGFKGATFIDAGSLFDVDDSGPNVLDKSSIRAAAGVGVSWSSPLGPISIDLAYPVASEEYDRTQVLRFNFGTRF